MTRSDPLSSTGKRHPPSVFARAGPAGRPRRRALLAGLAGRAWRSAPAAASTSPTTRQQSPSCRRRASGAAPPRPGRNRRPAGGHPHPRSRRHRRYPAQSRCRHGRRRRIQAVLGARPSPRPGGTAPSATPRWRVILRAPPSRHLRPGQGPAPRRHHSASFPLAAATPAATRTAITTAGFQLLRQHPPVPVSRQPAAVASRAARARDRPPPTRILTGGAPADRLAHRRVICEPELRPDRHVAPPSCCSGEEESAAQQPARMAAACCAGRPVAARRRRGDSSRASLSVRLGLGQPGGGGSEGRGDIEPW